MPSILQWNCRGLRTALADLQVTIGRQQPQIVCLQETKLAPDTSCSIKGYTVIRKDVASSTVAHGGVLLAVHHSVPTSPVPLSTSLQAVAATVQLGRPRLTVCSVYLPPGITFPLAELGQLVSELPPPVLLLGDFNSHHTVWGCETTDRRGRVLESFIRDECLCLLNTGTRTHMTLPSGQMSALDLSVTSPQLVPSIAWSVDTDPMGSDHFPVWLHFQGGAVIGERPPRWNLRKADWVQFEADLEEGFSGNHNDRDPPSVSTFTSQLIRSAEKSVPRTSGAPRRAPVPWWTDACRDAISVRKRAFRAFQRSSTTTNMIAFKKKQGRLPVERFWKRKEHPGKNMLAS